MFRILLARPIQFWRKELYHFRDQQGLEVDFLFPSGHGGLWMVECKASKTVKPDMTYPMGGLRRSMPGQAEVRSTVVHRPSRTALPSRALVPWADALDVRAFVGELRARTRRKPKGVARRPHAAR